MWVHRNLGFQPRFSGSKREWSENGLLTPTLKDLFTNEEVVYRMDIFFLKTASPNGLVIRCKRSFE